MVMHLGVVFAHRGYIYRRTRARVERSMCGRNSVAACSWERTREEAAASEGRRRRRPSASLRATRAMRRERRGKDRLKLKEGSALPLPAKSSRPQLCSSPACAKAEKAAFRDVAVRIPDVSCCAQEGRASISLVSGAPSAGPLTPRSRRDTERSQVSEFGARRLPEEARVDDRRSGGVSVMTNDVTVAASFDGR